MSMKRAHDLKVAGEEDDEGVAVVEESEVLEAAEGGAVVFRNRPNASFDVRDAPRFFSNPVVSRSHRQLSSTHPILRFMKADGGIGPVHTVISTERQNTENTSICGFFCH
jgi:hypothetical protein